MHKWIEQLLLLNVPQEICSSLALWENAALAWDNCLDGSCVVWLARALANGDRLLLSKVEHARGCVFGRQDKDVQTAIDEGRCLNIVGDPIRDGFAQARIDVYRAMPLFPESPPQAFSRGYADEFARWRAFAQDESAIAFVDALADRGTSNSGAGTRRDFMANYALLLDGLIEPLTGTTINDCTLDDVLDVRWRQVPGRALWDWHIRAMSKSLARVTGLNVVVVGGSIGVADDHRSAWFETAVFDRRVAKLGRADTELLNHGQLKLSLLGLELFPGTETEEFVESIRCHVAEQQSHING